MSIQESNKLIAEFMGAKVENKFVLLESRRYALSVKNYPTQLQYHRSWEWLMPVVEKIGVLRVKSLASYNPDLMFRIEIVNGYTAIEGTGTTIFFSSSIEGSMLTATYKAVLQFIQWYNSQPSNTK